jgi:hypothetical protein
MNAAAAFWTSIWESTKAVAGATLDQFLINTTGVLTGQGAERTITGAAFEAAGGMGLYGGQGFNLGGSARGMAYDEPGMMERQTRALENIDRKLGGS